MAELEGTELGYDAVVAALEALVSEWVNVSIEDAETLMGTVARVAGVLESPSVQDAMEGGVEGVVFIVGDASRSYCRGPSHFAVWRAPFLRGLREGDRISFRMGSILVIVEPAQKPSER